MLRQVSAPGWASLLPWLLVRRRLGCLLLLCLPLRLRLLSCPLLRCLPLLLACALGLHGKVTCRLATLASGAGSLAAAAPAAAALPAAADAAGRNVLLHKLLQGHQLLAPSLC